MSRPPLLLASSSPYRFRQLEGLGIPFETESPGVDETRKPGESPQDLVARLAREKAGALRDRYHSHLIVASDQVAVTDDGTLLTKPGTAERAFEQLQISSGSRVCFLTSLCLLDPARDRSFITVEPFVVAFRDLSDDVIRRYLDAEKPYNCAGSFKMEGLGIVLFERLDGRDPNALVGLPLIALEDGLRALDLSLLDYL